MSNIIWPPLLADELKKAEEETIARELEWLLNSLQETFASLKNGLEECNELLAPNEPGSTLVVSSMRSESVKGFITRTISFVAHDVQLRFPSLPPPPRQQSHPLRLSSLPTAPSFTIPQLSNTRNLIAQALDVVDTSRWTGDPRNAQFISGQLKLLLDLVREARQSLKGGEDIVGKWWESPLDEQTFDPSLPPNLALNLTISEASIIAHFRTLHVINPNTPTSFTSDALSGLSLRQRLGLAARLPDHDESDRTFHFRGQDVRVREKVRVESQDPSLMAAMAKLSALEHGIRVARRALGVVMGNDEGDED
ncbi:hypothetical protein MMC10_005703 [Thelotrema lepadinum]|nr:hypothetical protein [Thelotrema lepadinum]